MTGPTVKEEKSKGERPEALNPQTLLYLEIRKTRQRIRSGQSPVTNPHCSDDYTPAVGQLFITYQMGGATTMIITNGELEFLAHSACNVFEEICTGKIGSFKTKKTLQLSFFCFSRW